MMNDDDFFKWSADHSVNNKALDDQHQELISILNRLFIAVSKQEGDKAIVGTLDALIGYTETHFALEEQLMQQAKYAGLETHILEHKKFTERLDQFCKKYLLEEKPIYFEMLSFLKTWLKDHIQVVDIKYSGALKKIGGTITR